MEEIGKKEGEYIRKYKPVLNTQIPKEEDWHKFEVNTVDAAEVLKRFLYKGYGRLVSSGTFLYLPCSPLLDYRLNAMAYFSVAAFICCRSDFT